MVLLEMILQAASPSGGTSLDVGRRVLDIEARAVQALVQRLDGGFSEAVDLLYQCKGKVVVRTAFVGRP